MLLNVCCCAVCQVNALFSYRCKVHTMTSHDGTKVDEGVDLRFL